MGLVQGHKVWGVGARDSCAGSLSPGSAPTAALPGGDHLSSFEPLSLAP